MRFNLTEADHIKVGAYLENAVTKLHNGCKLKFKAAHCSETRQTVILTNKQKIAT